MLGRGIARQLGVPIHSSTVRRWLANNPKLEFLFQPVHHPWVNRIARLWKQLRDAVTRNHRNPTLESLMNAVRTLLALVQPFPGRGHALAKV